MTHRLKRQRITYHGGSTILSIPSRTFEAALSEQAEEIRLQREADQKRFEEAKAAYFEQMARSGLQSTEAEAMRRGWRRVELLMADLQREHEKEFARLRKEIRSLRQEAAATRIKLRAAEAEILSVLTNGGGTH